MNRFALLFSLLIVGVVRLPAQDTLTPPDVEELIAGYVKNIGGAEAWQAVTAIRMNGTASLQGLEFPLTITTATNSKQRIEIDIQGSPMIQAFDGQVAWMIFPMQGITEPKVLTDEESEALRDNPFPSEFINSAQRGYSLTAVRGKSVGGASTYGVRVTHQSGYDYTYYFDPQSLLPVLKVTTSRTGPTSGVEIETFLSNYRKEGDVILPMFMQERINGRETMLMTISDVVLNPELSEDFFALPR